MSFPVLLQSMTRLPSVSTSSEGYHLTQERHVKFVTHQYQSEETWLHNHSTKPHQRNSPSSKSLPMLQAYCPPSQLLCPSQLSQCQVYYQLTHAPNA